MIADSRWLRTTAVHVRPGPVAEYEALLKAVKAAREKASPPQTVLVSQAVAGQEGNIFYVTMLVNSMAGFDGQPSMQQILGNDGYERYVKVNAEAVSGTETAINRFLPEISSRCVNLPKSPGAAAIPHGALNQDPCSNRSNRWPRVSYTPTKPRPAP
jgi:hypothetical protein